MTVWCCFCSFGDAKGEDRGSMAGGEDREHEGSERYAVDVSRSEAVMWDSVQNLNFDLPGELVSSSTGGQNVRVFGAHEESSAAALERQNSGEHRKRPKFDSYIQECATGTPSDVIPCDSSSRRDGDGFQKMDECEVRMDLSDDLLHLVFSFLDHINLCRAAVVCKQWRAASTCEKFWMSLDFDNRCISLQQFEGICRRYPNAAQVKISGAPEVHFLAMQAVSALRNLKTLNLGKGDVGDAFFHSLRDCHVLEFLIINEATLGNGIQDISIVHENVHHLEITKCRVLRISLSCPLLEVLSLRRSNMTHAVLSCPRLHYLDINSCHKLSDAAIRSAATSCLLLETLDLSKCSCASDETVREIADRCAHLRVLDASYCSNISLESVRLPMLTKLKLDNCEGITSASMAAIAHSYMLEVLELDNCGLLTSVSLELPQLKYIGLRHCRKFADLNLRSVTLSTIIVSNCPLLSRISIASNSLEKLVLQKQGSLATLALQCHGLKEVDLTDCESLKNSICDVFSDGGGCPILKTLILDNAESLTAVRFCSSSLVCLSLAGCRAITSVELNCPHLEQLSLDGCDHLETASLCPVGLQSLNLGICPKLKFLSIEAPQMVQLELKGCGVLSDASINCPLLTSLDASFCSKLKDDCLSATSKSCSRIESLILLSCSSIGSFGLSSLDRLQHLSWLDLSYTFLVDLQPVFDSCLHLKVLKLLACKDLSDSSLEPLYKVGALPALQELDLSYGKFHQSVIEELLTCCTHLTHVSLNGCENMCDLNWGLDRTRMLPDRLLQNLSCVGCVKITRVLISPMAGCSHLSSLNLSLSPNLKEVDISCSNISSLNLSNCNSLEILKLNCPRLTSLHLQSCNIKEEAIKAALSQCSMLETLDIRSCKRICLRMLREVCPSLKRISHT